MNAVEASLQKLKILSLVQEEPEGNYLYRPLDAEMSEVVNELAEAYRVQRHSVLGLIFSPLKKARDFAEAFRVGKDKKDGDDG